MSIEKYTTEERNKLVGKFKLKANTVRNIHSSGGKRAVDEHIIVKLVKENGLSLGRFMALMSCDVEEIGFDEIIEGESVCR